MKSRDVYCYCIVTSGFKELIIILSAYTEHMCYQKHELFQPYSLQFTRNPVNAAAQQYNVTAHTIRADGPRRMSKP